MIPTKQLPILLAIPMLALAPPEATAQTSFPAPGHVVKGRFVDDDGKPIPRVEVRIRGLQSTGYSLAWSLADWIDPQPVTTGPDGRFAFVVPAPTGGPARARYSMDTTHAEHVGWFSDCPLAVLADLGGHDYGDIALPGGVRPRIKAVDKRGDPQPGVSFLLRMKNATAAARIIRPDFGPRSWVTVGDFATTDIDGSLRLTEPMQAGLWTIGLRNRSGSEPPIEVQLPTTKAIEFVVPSVAKEDIIQGRLLYSDDIPVVGSTLQATASGTSCRTLRDGRFLLLRSKKDRGDSVVLKHARNRRYDGWDELPPIPWGARDVELRLPGRRLVTFLVHSGGTPVTRANLICQPRSKDQFTAPARMSGTFERGKIRCRLHDGDYRILVHPRTDAIVGDSGWREITVTAETKAIEIELPALETRTIRVHTGDRLVADARVEILRGAPQAGKDYRSRPAEIFHDQTHRVNDAMVWARGRTDQEGALCIGLPKGGEGDLFARIIAPGTIETLVEISQNWAAGGVLDLTVAPACRITGRIGPITAVDALDVSTEEERAKSLALGRSRSPHSRGSFSTNTLADLLARRRPAVVVLLGPQNSRWGGGAVVLDEKGRFAIDHLPPGKIRLALIHFVRDPNNDKLVREAPTLHQLGEFELKPGVPAAVELQLPQALR